MHKRIALLCSFTKLNLHGHFPNICRFFSLQGEEDAALAPQEGDEGFQFDSSSGAPAGGYEF